MNNEEFNKIVEERISLIKSVLVKKQAEYSSKTDRLHNFKVGSRMTGKTPEQVLQGFRLKHEISINDIVEGVPDNLPEKDLLQEKIGDSINYLILLEALLIERINNKSNDIKDAFVILDDKDKKNSILCLKCTRYGNSKCVTTITMLDGVMTDCKQMIKKGD